MIVNMSLNHAIIVSREMRYIDRREVMATRWSDDADAFAIESFNLPGVAYTALGHHGQPVAIGGVAIHTPHVGTAWMVATDDFQQVGVSVTRQLRKMIDTLLAAELNRIHAWSATFHTEAHEWLERAGMVRENPVRAMGKNGEDFYIYAAVREGELCV